MADSSDVEVAIVTLVAGVLGNSQAVRVYRGMPQAMLLDADLAAGCPNVTVVANGDGVNTTRYLQNPCAIAVAAGGLAVAVDGTQVVFSGVGGAGQVAGLVVDGVGWAYRLVAADTPSTCAAALAAAIPGASAQGAVLTVAGLDRAHVAVDRTASQEVMRQQRRYQISFWCNAPAQRDVLVATVDPVLAGTAFLNLADGTLARFKAAGERVIDKAENARLWRRDLLYDAEYLTVQQSVLPEMLFGTLVACLQRGVVAQIGDLVMPETVLTDTQGRVMTDAAGHSLGE